MTKVKEKRIANNLSQAALAYELEMSPGFIGQIESPRYSAKYNVQHLNALARILNCSPKDFLPEKPI